MPRFAHFTGRETMTTICNPTFDYQSKWAIHSTVLLHLLFHNIFQVIFMLMVLFFTTFWGLFLSLRRYIRYSSYDPFSWPCASVIHDLSKCSRYIHRCTNVVPVCKPVVSSIVHEKSGYWWDLSNLIHLQQGSRVSMGHLGLWLVRSGRH